MVAPARISSARTSAAGRRRAGAGPVAASSGWRAENRRRGQHGLEVLERGAPHVDVVGREGAGGDPHRLPLQSEREKVEDVLPDPVRVAAATELSLDECQSAGEGLQRVRGVRP